MADRITVSGTGRSTLSAAPAKIEPKGERDPDERVTLAPLSPETALRGLLATPPAEGQD